MPELPNYIRRFLKVVCPIHLLEEIEGDLEQQFRRDADRYGAGKAHRRAVWSSIRFLRPGIILRNRIGVDLHGIDMLWIYFRIACRHLLKSKAYSFINVVGLAVGLIAFFSSRSM